MVAFGYTLMTEQRAPRDLVADAVAAENAGFDFEVCSDHYNPWLDSQGHAPNAWAVLGAVAASTQRREPYRPHQRERGDGRGDQHAEPVLPVRPAAMRLPSTNRSSRRICRLVCG